jgi:hypothetical protein
MSGFGFRDISIEEIWEGKENGVKKDMGLLRLQVERVPGMDGLVPLQIGSY